MAAKLDATWQVGIAWGVALTILTIGGVWLAFRGNMPAGMFVPVLAWVGFVGWLERGVK